MVAGQIFTIDALFGIPSASKVSKILEGVSGGLCDLKKELPIVRLNLQRTVTIVPLKRSSETCLLRP